MSIFLAKEGGDALSKGQVGVYIGLFGLALCLANLSLSLSHLARAMGDITRSGVFASWSSAIVLDGAIIFCECLTVAGFGNLGVDTAMGVLTLVSMLGNCWAFKLVATNEASDRRLEGIRSGGSSIGLTRAAKRNLARTLKKEGSGSNGKGSV